MTWYYPWGWVVIVVFLSTSYASFDDKFSILFAYIFNYAHGHAHSLIYLEWLINLFILFLSYCLNSSIFIRHLLFIWLPICIMLVCIEIMSTSLNACKISCFNINEYICRLITSLIYKQDLAGPPCCLIFLLSLTHWYFIYHWFTISVFILFFVASNRITPVFAISSVTGLGVDLLRSFVGKMLTNI